MRSAQDLDLQALEATLAVALLLVLLAALLMACNADSPPDSLWRRRGGCDFPAVGGADFFGEAAMAVSE